MQRIVGRIKNERTFLLGSLLYAAGIAFVFPYLRFYVDNPDTISYITIARKYAHADFPNAVNGYWSPLISWMLALLMKLQRDEIITFKLLQILIGWFALYHFVKLAHSFIHSSGVRVIVSLAFIPFLLSYSLLNLTPDLLFLSAILLYLRSVSEKEFFNHRHFGLIAGVLGVLMYFSKAFGFWFFLVHFTILSLKNILQTKEYAFKRHLRKNYFQAMVCFIGIASIWIYLVSYKYGHFTISENASFNLSREVAAGPGEQNKLPVLSGGLYQPVNTTAVNAWEDPGFLTVTPLHPLSVAADMKLYREVLKRNLLTIYYFDFRRQTGIVFFILLVAFLFSRKRKKILTDDYLFSLFFAILIVYSGFALILVHTRYVWICTILMLLLTCRLLEELLWQSKSQKLIAKILFVCFVLLSIKRPVKEILFSGDNEMSASVLFNSIIHPVETMGMTYAPDVQLRDVTRRMKPLVRPGASIVSIIDSNTMRDGYTKASLFALGTNAKYLGQVSEDDPVLQDQSMKFNFDYLIYFPAKIQLPDTIHWSLLFSSRGFPMNIYSRKK